MTLRIEYNLPFAKTWLEYDIKFLPDKNVTALEMVSDQTDDSNTFKLDSNNI